MRLPWWSNDNLIFDVVGGRDSILWHGEAFEECRYLGVAVVLGRHPCRDDMVMRYWQLYGVTTPRGLARSRDASIPRGSARLGSALSWLLFL